MSEHLHSWNWTGKWAHKKDGDASALKKQLNPFPHVLLFKDFSICLAMSRTHHTQE